MFDSGLHLYKCCINFGIKELKIINQNYYEQYQLNNQTKFNLSLEKY